MCAFAREQRATAFAISSVERLDELRSLTAGVVAVGIKCQGPIVHPSGTSIRRRPSALVAAIRRPFSPVLDYDPERNSSMRRFRGDAAAYAAIVQRLDNALETEFHAELTRRPYRSLQHAPAMRLFDGWVEIGECTLLNPESGSSIAFVAVPFQFGRNCCRLSPLSSCSNSQRRRTT